MAEELLAEPSVLLIKLDTPGTELEIPQGGVETLRRTRFVLVEMNSHEVYRGTCQYFQVDELLRRIGFRLVAVVVTYCNKGLDTREYDARYETRGLRS